jgi:hypothetical protein
MYKTIPLVLTILYTAAIAEKVPCSQSKQALFYCPHAMLEDATYQGFASELFSNLYPQLLQIGYCLVRSDSLAALRDSAKFADNLVMYLWSGEQNSPGATRIRNNEAQKELVISLVPLRQFFPQELERSVGRPLVTMPYMQSEIRDLRVIFVKKIIESLRTQYICYLSINSEPSGITIRSSSDLEGVTPLKWVLPVATITIQGVAPKYVPLKKEIRLEHPGEYTYFLELKKRQFYNSNFIYPATFCAVSVVGCYALDKYYSNKYLRLGENDYYTNPGSFESTFNRAKTFERLTIASFAMSGVFFGLSIWF